MGAYTSTLRWDDVPPDQRETPAELAQDILFFSRHPWDVATGGLMRPWLRGKLSNHAKRDAGRPACPMATRQSYDRKRRVWTYAPCALSPRASGYCWRHEKSPGRR